MKIDIAIGIEDSTKFKHIYLPTDLTKFGITLLALILSEILSLLPSGLNILNTAAYYYNNY